LYDGDEGGWGCKRLVGGRGVLARGLVKFDRSRRCGTGRFLLWSVEDFARPINCQETSMGYALCGQVTKKGKEKHQAVAGELNGDLNGSMAHVDCPDMVDPAFYNLGLLDGGTTPMKVTEHLVVTK
jgi:hypothetical protein